MQPAAIPHAAPLRRIVIVEDDAVISDLMREAFEGAGFVVSEVTSGFELKAQLAKRDVSLVTLDLGLPGEDGIDLAREIRAAYDVPIIIVTGRAKPVNRIVGLEVGADDYLVKPFDLDELVARARAVLRRSRRMSFDAAHHAPPALVASVNEDIVMFDNWRFDIAGHRLWRPSGDLVNLTSAEFELLAIFVRSPRTPLTRAEIAFQLNGDDDTSTERSIDVIVGRLRRKLEQHSEGVEFIKTLRGAGYLFSPSAHPAA
jgi:two-component system, OmpR family, response regulator